MSLLDAARSHAFRAWENEFRSLGFRAPSLGCTASFETFVWAICLGVLKLVRHEKSNGQDYVMGLLRGGDICIHIPYNRSTYSRVFCTCCCLSDETLYQISDYNRARF